MKTKFFAIFTVLMLALSSAAFADSSTGFSDISENAPYAEAVKYCRDHELMSGTSETEFSPDDNTSRAMLVTILHRQQGTPTITNTSAFEDVAEDSWYFDAVRWGAANGIVSGYDDTHFAPEDNLSREQILTILWRMSESPDVAAVNLPYTDESQISDYAKTAVQWAYSNEIIPSAATLEPTGTITRAEMAQILYNFLNMNNVPQPPQEPTTEPTTPPTPPSRPDNSTDQPATQDELKVRFGDDGEQFTLYMENNETGKILTQYAAMDTWRLPIYHFEGYEHDDVMFYYDIPSRYTLPTSPQAITEEKGGEVYIDENNRVMLFFHDATVEGQFTKIGHFNNTDEFVNAAEDNPVLQGWGNKIIIIQK